MIADDPGNWIEFVEEAMAGTTESSEGESTTSEEKNYDETSASIAVFSTNLSSLGELDNLTGVLRVTWSVDMICFLHCIFIALFIS
ncbi:MAG: hypothetical protein IKX04_05865, partial [Clostridiales bacterium]|nr:hypothetical protein [Clostridiales bacterium]